MEEFTIKELFFFVITFINLLVWGPIGFMLRKTLQRYEEDRQQFSKDIKAIDSKFNDLRAEIPEKYLMITRFEDQINKIESMLQWIQDKMNDKADK